MSTEKRVRGGLASRKSFKGRVPVRVRPGGIASVTARARSPRIPKGGAPAHLTQPRSAHAPPASPTGQGEARSWQSTISSSPRFQQLVDAPVKDRGKAKGKGGSESLDTIDEEEIEDITVNLDSKFSVLSEDEESEHDDSELDEEDEEEEEEERPEGPLTYAQAHYFARELSVDESEYPEGAPFNSPRLFGDLTLSKDLSKGLPKLLKKVPLEHLTQPGPRSVYFQAAVQSLYSVDVKKDPSEYSGAHTKAQRIHVRRVFTSCYEAATRDIAWYEEELHTANERISSLETSLEKSKDRSRGTHEYDADRQQRIDTRHLPRDALKPDFSGMEVFTGSREQEIVEWLTMMQERMLQCLESTKVIYLKTRLDTQLQTNLVAAFPDFHKIALKGNEKKGKELFDQVCTWLVTKYQKVDSLELAITKYTNCKQKKGELIQTYFSRLGIQHATALRLGMDDDGDQHKARLLRGGRGEGAKPGLFLKDILKQIYEDHPVDYLSMKLGDLVNAAKVAELKIRQAESTTEGFAHMRAEERWSQPHEDCEEESESEEEEEEGLSYARGANTTPIGRKKQSGNGPVIIDGKSRPRLDVTIYKERQAILKKGKKLSADELALFKDDKIKHPKTGESVRYCASCHMTGHTVGHCFIREKTLNSLDVEEKPPRKKKGKGASKSARKKQKKK